MNVYLIWAIYESELILKGIFSVFALIYFLGYVSSRRHSGLPGIIPRLDQEKDSFQPNA